MKLVFSRVALIAIATMLIAMIVFSLSSFARAQGAAVPDPTANDWRTLFTPPVWVMILGFLGTLITMPITTVLKNILKTEGINTLIVNSVVNTFLLGLIPWLTGTVPFLYAVLSSLIGIGMDKLTHSSIKDIASTVTPGSDQ
jgi:xanthosine utilization system XapX-like protein